MASNLLRFSGGSGEGGIGVGRLRVCLFFYYKVVGFYVDHRRYIVGGLRRHKLFVHLRYFIRELGCVTLKNGKRLRASFLEQWDNVPGEYLSYHVF